MGRKDLLFRDQRIIVFVNDCFWYGHRDCPERTRSHPAFWTARAERLRKRNMATFKRFTLEGWTVITVWDCQDEEEGGKDFGPRRYFPEYLQAIYRELSRLLLLLTT